MFYFQMYIYYIYKREKTIRMRVHPSQLSASQLHSVHKLGRVKGHPRKGLLSRVLLYIYINVYIDSQPCRARVSCHFWQIESHRAQGNDVASRTAQAVCRYEKSTFHELIRPSTEPKQFLYPMQFQERFLNQSYLNIYIFKVNP